MLTSIKSLAAYASLTIILSSCSILGFHQKTNYGKRYTVNHSHWGFYKKVRKEIDKQVKQWTDEHGDTSSLTVRQRSIIARKTCDAYNAHLEQAPDSAPGNFATAKQILTDEQRFVCRKSQRLERKVKQENKFQATPPKHRTYEPLQAVGAAKLQRRAKMSDAQIRVYLMKKSQKNYSGRCPCPYYVDSRGRRCGKRSAYSRRGGRSVLCYKRNVSQQMIEDYRERRR